MTNRLEMLWSPPFRHARKIRISYLSCAASSAAKKAGFDVVARSIQLDHDSNSYDIQLVDDDVLIPVWTNAYHCDFSAA